ncbi:hypothetical protein I317_01714 [Kwoniella heveanensis CBS 569]|nr:hypothetical protein I317_01714 [Kwoniella heveanensis CBS 569]
MSMYTTTTTGFHQQATGASAKAKGITTILIVGAGVGGLSAAYALRQSKAFREGLMDVRVVEGRGGGGVDEQEGYPIHLSSSGRQALSALLTPHDLKLLHDARSEIPVLHDGLTVSSYTGKQVYRLIRDPCCQPMVERKRLLNILRSSAGEVEYGVEVKDVRQLAGGKVVVGLDDGGERIEDLVIAADGMFSPVRRSLLSSVPSAQNQGPVTVKKSEGHAALDEITRMGYTTINLRTSSSAIVKWVKDPKGINMIYGDSFSATLIPLLPSISATYVNTTAPTNPSSEGTTPVKAVYVALTVPSKWFEPTFAARIEQHCDCPQTIAGAFLRDLEHSDGWPTRRGFELWSTSRTNGGQGRVVLIGDAAHGMVPFCGAGASAAIVDAVQLVNALDLELRANDNHHTLDLALNEFRSQSVIRNDPLIFRSKKLLWLAQGDGEVVRIVRRAVFWGLEMKERIGGERKRLERELQRLSGASKTPKEVIES